jgi:hypothetical protein
MKSAIRYASRGLLALTLSVAMFAQACSTTWLSKLDTILAAAAPAVINVLNIVAIAEGKPVNAALEAKIAADANNLKVLAANLAAAGATATTTCQQAQAAVTTLGDDFTLVLQIVQVSNAASQTNALIVFQAADAIFLTISALLPSCAPPVVASVVFKVSTLDANTLISNYNSVLDRPTNNSLVNAYNRKHHVHGHGWLARTASLGHQK